jgi:hypothetical protein
MPKSGSPMPVESAPPSLIAGHPVARDRFGRLKPWTAWTDALAREMEFYQQCPSDQGYPRFAHVTFLDGDWQPLADRIDSIPATQNGMGILSYLKFFELGAKRDSRFLKTACLLGDYLVNETLTPNSGRYPAFTRSTGARDRFPQLADSGSQADRPYEIEPDKGGIAGYALMQLFGTANDSKYLGQALQNARVLAATQEAGDESRSPWPFRADFRTGEGRGLISGNMSFVLRLYDALIAEGFREFSESRASLWQWIKRFQIPSAAAAGTLFAQFFEDHDTPTNRTAWAPLNLARYLLEQKELLDSEWRADARTLLDFVREHFTHQEFGVTVCHEQDEDHQAWGGVASTYGAVLALYAHAIDSTGLAAEARQTLDLLMYAIDAQGRPRDRLQSSSAGGWQEDAHTDVIHNYVDALRAFPDWGEAP